jgi:hypothetical protein
MLSAGSSAPVLRFVPEPEEVQVGFELRIFSGPFAQAVDGDMQNSVCPGNLLG